MTNPAMVELEITGTAYGGKGIARIDGKVYFVEDAIEGDIVLAEITQDNDRYSNAIARTILKPSRIRIQSRCDFSSECGGCQWQEVPYIQQLDWKKKFVENSIQRISKLELPEVDIIESREVQNYRNRILLRGRFLTDGSLVVGYFRRGSREFTSVNRCNIASENINRFISLITSLRFAKISQEVKFRFEVQELPFQANTKNLVVSVYDPEGASLSLVQIIDHFRKIDGILWVGSVRESADAPFFEFESDLGITFHTSPGQFQQVNLELNKTLRRLVLSTVDRLKPKSVLDLFCGSGNLSLPLAKNGISVVGVEYSKRAIDGAKHNLAVNRIENAEYFSGDTEKFLSRAAKSNQIFDLVIADPPREGMYKSLVPLMNIGPKYLIYVSCDPTTLARDLGSLCKSNYRILEIKALDFFPNTYHVETFAVLEKIH